MLRRVTVILLIIMSMNSVHTKPFGMIDRFANSNSFDNKLLAKHNSLKKGTLSNQNFIWYNQILKFLHRKTSNLGYYFNHSNLYNQKQPAMQHNSKKILTPPSNYNNIRKG